MTRVKRSTTAKKKRKKILKMAKGYMWSRNNRMKQAKEAVSHALRYQFRDRRARKREFRGLWQNKIGAAAKLAGISYSKFIHALKIKNIQLDRKVLADIAENNPQVFKNIVAQVTAK